MNKTTETVSYSDKPIEPVGEGWRLIGFRRHFDRFGQFKRTTWIWFK